MNDADRLLNAAADHIAATLEQPSNYRAWDQILIYAPSGAVFNRLVKALHFDGPNIAGLTLGEIARAVEGAKLPESTDQA